MKIQNVKGGYDYPPESQEIREYINNIIIKNFKRFGFKPIETPILCYYDLLTDKYDKQNDILKEIYKLTDQGNRMLGLRYDLTVPFAKFIALNKNSIVFPFKRYEIAKVFRDGPVKVGRDREFTQCDADVVGLSGQEIEAELISIYVKTFKELNINIIIKYNSRKLMIGLILESGVTEDKLQNVTTILDKINKISIDEIKLLLSEDNVSSKSIDDLIKYFKMSYTSLKKEFCNTKNELIKEGIRELDNLKKYLKALQINDYCNIDISLARGQNYYTGNVFEVYDKEKRVNGSIGAGGRYDKMIGQYIDDGQIYPAVGISFGLSSIYEIMKSQRVSKKSETDIYIIPLDDIASCFKIANLLRERYNVEISFKNKKISKELEYADKNKIKYVIIVGSNELKTGIIGIKNMFDKTTVNVSLDKIKDIIL